MAGGYGRDIDVTVDVHLRTLRPAHESLAALAYLRNDPALA